MLFRGQNRSEFHLRALSWALLSFKLGLEICGEDREEHDNNIHNYGEREDPCIRSSISTASLQLTGASSENLRTPRYP